MFPFHAKRLRLRQPTDNCWTTVDHVTTLNNNERRLNWRIIRWLFSLRGKTLRTKVDFVSKTLRSELRINFLELSIYFLNCSQGNSLFSWIASVAECRPYQVSLLNVGWLETRTSMALVHICRLHNWGSDTELEPKHRIKDNSFVQNAENAAIIFILLASSLEIWRIQMYVDASLY